MGRGRRSRAPDAVDQGAPPCHDGITSSEVSARSPGPTLNGPRVGPGGQLRDPTANQPSGRSQQFSTSAYSEPRTGARKPPPAGDADVSTDGEREEDLPPAHARRRSTVAPAVPVRVDAQVARPLPGRVRAPPQVVGQRRIERPVRRPDGRAHDSRRAVAPGRHEGHGPPRRSQLGATPTTTRRLGESRPQRSPGPRRVIRGSGASRRTVTAARSTSGPCSAPRRSSRRR